jgi:pimeloyl-ACP methyl ester carboxylesterase
MNILKLGLVFGLGFLPLSAPGPELSGQGPVSLAPTSGYVSVGSDSLFYEVEGQGPALILVHDGLIHREVWDAQFRFFSDRFRVVRYDRRGYGASSLPSEAFSDIQDLEALYDHLGIEKAGLVAMSSGGRLAIDFTLVHPDRVSSLVLVGAVVRGFSYTEHFFTRGGHLPPDLPASERRRWYASEDPYEIYRENRAAKARALELVGDAPFRDHGSLPGSSTLPPPPAALERLGEIAVPTLILVGEFDIPDVHAHAGAINAGIPGSRRDIVPRSGHLIPLEQPDLFNQAVLAFVEQETGGRPNG